jgi:hypothetical protein
VVKLIEVNWKDWDGDVSKLSPQAVKGLLAVCDERRRARKLTKRPAKLLASRLESCRPR